MGATLGGIMFPLGATFCATTTIDHAGHGTNSIEVGPPHARVRIGIANSMNETKRKEKL
jgi:hypothetical protein